jgi:hypothetical protein
LGQAGWSDLCTLVVKGVKLISLRADLIDQLDRTS